MSVTIVVPIHNAAPSVRALMDRLDRSWRRPKNESLRVVLINDASTDPRIERLLARHRLMRRPEVEAMTLTQNRGFAAAVNAGILAAWTLRRCDILILNSDALLDLSDLPRLQKAARGNRVASATPLTQRASLVGICNWPVGGSLPRGGSFDHVRSVVARLGLKHAPKVELPMAVGFCTYLTHRALAEVGLLDERTFGRGYGELADWSLRAGKKNWVHRACTNVFVSHEGAKSFGRAQKVQLLKRNEPKLARLHPDHRLKVDRWVKANPLRPIREAIGFEVLRVELKKKPGRAKRVRTLKTRGSSGRRSR